jgi:hypothetical protein
VRGLLHRSAANSLIPIKRKFLAIRYHRTFAQASSAECRISEGCFKRLKLLPSTAKAFLAGVLPWCDTSSEPNVIREGASLLCIFRRNCR